MAESEKAILTALCMVYDGNKILLQDRVKADWQGLTLPGGHVEPNESFVETVIREIKEETGLTISNPQLCGIKQFPTDNNERYVVLLFKSDKFSGKLVSSDEGKMIWIDRNELTSIPVANGFWDVMKIYDDIGLTELIYEHDKSKDEWTTKYY